MAVTKKLRKAVSARDYVGIRDALWSRIALDPNFSKGFPESLNYCFEQGILEKDLYEEHDNRPTSDEVSNDNFSALCGELSTNFSKERLEKIKEIGRKLYPVEEKPKSQTSTQTSGTRRTTVSSTKSDNADSGLLIAVGAGILIGAIGGGILGGLLLKKAVVGAIAGAAIGVGVGAGIGKASSTKYGD